MWEFEMEHMDNPSGRSLDDGGVDLTHVENMRMGLDVVSAHIS